MTLAQTLGYPYEDDPLSYEEMTFGADTPRCRKVDRERFAAVLQLNREMAARRGATVKVQASWTCDRCGLECTATAEVPPAGLPLALTPDPHVCAPAGWWRVRAVWRGTGTGTRLAVPEIPRHLVAVVLGPPAP